MPRTSVLLPTVSEPGTGQTLMAVNAPSLCLDSKIGRKRSTPAQFQISRRRV